MMGRQARRGFTIIETMLVLGISGMMLAGMMVGVGAGIASQRYKDSVSSLVDYFQGQYSLVANVNNPRDNQSYCNATSGIVTTPEIAPRATSDCTIVGRLLRGDTSTVTSIPIYATVDPDTLMAESDALVALSKLDMVEDVDRSDAYDLEWGARMYPMGAQASNYMFTVAIIRSPFSGAVNTFVDSTGSTTTIGGLLNSGSLLNNLELCVDSSGGMSNVNSSPLGVKIAPNAASSAGVAMIGEGGGC